MVSHIVGGAIGIATLVLCVVIAALRGSVGGILCGVAFGVTMTALYTMSSIYHGLRPSMAKKVFQVMDHCTIYFLIAGTYTPILVCSMARIAPVAAWVTFGVIWGLTALATTLTAIDLHRYKKFSMVCYVGMGWAVLFTLKSAVLALGAAGFLMVLAGGIAYTVGVIFFLLGKNKRYFHSIFHLFVVAGSVLHALAVIFYVMMPL